MLCSIILALMLTSAIIADEKDLETAGIFNYHRHVYHPIGNSFLEKLNFSPSNQIVVNYTITFNTTKCCPVVGYWRLVDQLERQLLDEGYHSGCTQEDYQVVGLYSSYSIYCNADFPKSGCRIVGDQTVCVGSRTMVNSVWQPVRWAIAIGYECKHQPNIDIIIDMRIEFKRSFEIVCKPMGVPYCKDHFGYDLTTLPNAFGQDDPIEANKVMALALRAAPLFTCYQHFLLFSCYQTFPECRSGKQYVPCLKMCREFTEACRDSLRLFNQPIHCESNPDSLDPDVCFYKPVMCPKVQPPSSGSIFTEGHSQYDLSTYKCDEGFKLQGQAVRQCEASGKWNSTNPTCEPLYPTLSHKTVLLSTIVAGLLLIVVAIPCVYHCRENIKMIVFFNRHEPFNRRHEEQKTLFIAYSSEDRDEVSVQFLPQLQNQLRGWTMQTYQQDFVAGRPILDCIKEGVWESQAVLVLLTESFVKSHWCLHEFIEAETRSVLDQSFKLIVIISTHENQALPVELMQDLPESLKRYIRTRIYLPLWEPLFWNKLRQALSK